MTEGREGKLILQFSVPMLIGNVFQQLYNMVDSIVVGQSVGKEALAAVGASFPIMFFMISIIMGITMGASIMLSQFFGAKDTANLRKTIDTTYIFMILSSLVISVLGIILAGPILRLVKIPPEVFPLARQYLIIIFAGMVFVFGYNGISAILRGLGDSKNPLYFLIVATVVNIFLDLLFVLVFKWGVAGVAWATVIAQAISFVLSVIYLQKSKFDILRINLKTIRFDWTIFRTSLKIGLPSGIQQALVSLGFVALTRIVNPFGTGTIAGYTAATRLDSMAAIPAMNISMAVSTFVGQNMGAKKIDRVKRGFIAGLLISGAISVAISLIMLLFRFPLVGFFTKDAEVITVGSSYLLIVSAFYIIFSCMFITGGVLRGAGATFVAMVGTLIALWVVRIPASAILSRHFGSNGIWWGIPAGWIVGFSFSFIYYLTGKWKTKAVVN